MKELIDRFLDLINLSIGIVVAIALLVFFWGLVRYALHSGDKEKHEEGRSIMVWGVVVLFIMTTIGGIIYFFQRSLDLVPPNNINDAPPTERIDFQDNDPFGPLPDGSRSRNI